MTCTTELDNRQREEKAESKRWAESVLAMIEMSYMSIWIPIH